MMTVGDLTIRRMRPEDLATVLDWATAEGWNPGAEDGPCFAAADPEGMLIGLVGRRPIASIAAVAYGRDFGFLGLYLIVEDQRGRGYGFRMWQAALDHLGDRRVGLDGVPAQQENYLRSGFSLAYRHIRFAGSPEVGPAEDPAVVPLADVDFARLAEFDRGVFRAPREAFLACWCGSADKRPGSAVVRDGALAGYGVVRRCRTGSKIGPLFAADEAAADLLFRRLVAGAPGTGPVFIDVPEPNPAAMALAARYSLLPVSETGRMYNGRAWPVPIHAVYGATTLELG